MNFVSEDVSELLKCDFIFSGGEIIFLHVVFWNDLLCFLSRVKMLTHISTNMNVNKNYYNKKKKIILGGRIWDS